MITAYAKEEVTIVDQATTAAGREIGAPTLTPAKAVIDWREHLVIDEQGDKISSSGVATFSPKYTILSTSKVRIDSKDYRIISLLTQKVLGKVIKKEAHLA